MFDSLTYDHPWMSRVYLYAFVVLFGSIVIRVILAALQYFVFLQGLIVAQQKLTYRAVPSIDLDVPDKESVRIRLFRSSSLLQEHGVRLGSFAVEKPPAPPREKMFDYISRKKQIRVCWLCLIVVISVPTRTRRRSWSLLPSSWSSGTAPFSTRRSSSSSPASRRTCPFASESGCVCSNRVLDVFSGGLGGTGPTSGPPRGQL